MEIWLAVIELVLASVYRWDYYTYFNRSRGYFEEAIIGMIVYGFEPGSLTVAMDFLTQWARSLTFSYANAPTRELFKWGYALSELARGKVAVGSIPVDEHDDSRRVLVFHDVGTPIRHIYTASRVGNAVVVEGLGIVLNEHMTVELEFRNSEQDLNIIEPGLLELARQVDIHTVPHRVLDKKKRVLIKKIIELSREHRRRYGYL